jgi:hypothetical protein
MKNEEKPASESGSQSREHCEGVGNRRERSLFTTAPVEFGGAEGIRTLDLLDAIEARSQLRHGPTDRQLLNFSTAQRIASRTEGQEFAKAGMPGRNLKKVALARMVMSEAARVAASAGKRTRAIAYGRVRYLVGLRSSEG